MARYRSKDDVDKAWNRIRRHITRELDTAIQDSREEALDALLTNAWEKFTIAIGEGKVPEVEARYAAFSLAVVKDIVPDPEKLIEGIHAPVD